MGMFWRQHRQHIPCRASKTMRPPARHLQEAHVLSQKGAGSLWIQAIDCGLITHEDILINCQIPELPHPPCHPPSPICSHLLSQHTKKGAVGQEHNPGRERHPEGFAGWREGLWPDPAILGAPHGLITWLEMPPFLTLKMGAIAGRVNKTCTKMLSFGASQSQTPLA